MKEKIVLKELFENYYMPEIINYAGPVMIALAFLEMFISWRQQKGLYEKKDFIASLAIGGGYIFQGLFTKSVLFVLAIWCYNLVPWSIPMNWWTSILCFVALDFFRYYAHRIAHETNFLWATHVTHHNSEKYNLSTSFRLSWTQQIKIIFFLPISFLGFHPVTFFICHQLAVLYQFWIHTELIRKLPKWFEFFFVTPSHHRVHHGRNEKYLDKNYGSTLIIWDKILGTFQPEEERPEYGILHPVKGHNPVRLVFHVWVDIFRDLRKARSFKEGTAILFRAPGKYNRDEFR